MLRFSIRELMVLTVAVSLGVAWFVDHRRLQGALVTTSEARDDAIAEAKSERERQDRLAKLVDEGLAEHGFKIELMCAGDSMIPRINKVYVEQRVP